MERPRGVLLASFTCLAATGAAFSLVAFLFPHILPHRAAGIRSAARVAQVRLGNPHRAIAFSTQTKFTNRDSDGAKGGSKENRKTDEASAERSAAATFDSIYNLVKDYYVDPMPSDTILSKSAVKAMLLSLGDPNSYFLEPAQRAVFDDEAQGHFAGIGAHLIVLPQKRDGYTEYKITVVAPIAGSPAEHSAIHSGDTITHIDGKWILGSDPFLRVNKLLKRHGDSADEDSAEIEREYRAARQRVQGGIGLFAAQMLLRSGAGKTVHLTVLHSGSREPVTVNLTTAVTVEPSLEGKLLDNHTGYLHLTRFDEKSATLLAEQMNRWGMDIPVVLDLRGATGGSLEAAEQIFGILTGGETFAHEVVSGGKTISLSVPKNSVSRHHSLAVLTDRSSASTAEAIAIALREANAATLVGETTFGDASVQTLYTLTDGSAFVLTSGKLLSPKETDWSGVGVAPGVRLPSELGEKRIIERAAELASGAPSLRSQTSGAKNNPGNPTSVPISPDTTAPANTPQTLLPTETYYAVMQTIRHDFFTGNASTDTGYREETKTGDSRLAPRRLTNAAIDGMLAALNDRYTEYWTPEEYRSNMEETRGNFVGIGATLDQSKEGRALIQHPIEGSPAARAGLLPGDFIVGINDKSAVGLDVAEVIDRIRGQEGTTVRLTIERRGMAKPFTVTLVRALVQSPVIEARMENEEAKVGYIKLEMFSEQANRQLGSALAGLEKQGMRALIFDLRGNPGGLLNVAQSIASRFLDKGPVVWVREKNGQMSSLDVEEAQHQGKLSTGAYPVIVLVNGDSASASEIVCGAIQDAGRGQLLGTRTFGKGLVQTIIPLGDQSAVKITTQHYYTRNRHDINRHHSASGEPIPGSGGIQPDYVVDFSEKERERQHDALRLDPQNRLLADKLDPQISRAMEILREKVATKLTGKRTARVHPASGT